MRVNASLGLARDELEPEPKHKTFWKNKGAYLVKREQRKLDAKALEKREKAKARKRDGRCRWPEAHKCLGGLEAAHIVHASLGGAMAAENLITLCAWVHRRGPETQQYGDLKVEKETAAGANGPLSFWRKLSFGERHSLARGGTVGEFYLVAREIAPFRYERD